MFRAHCEYIWHITCVCKFYWTMAVMFKGCSNQTEVTTVHQDARKGRIEVDEEPTNKQIQKNYKLLKVQDSLYCTFC